MRRKLRWWHPLRRWMPALPAAESVRSISVTVTWSPLRRSFQLENSVRWQPWAVALAVDKRGRVWRLRRLRCKDWEARGREAARSLRSAFALRRPVWPRLSQPATGAEPLPPGLRANLTRKQLPTPAARHRLARAQRNHPAMGTVRAVKMACMAFRRDWSSEKLRETP